MTTKRYQVELTRRAAKDVRNLRPWSDLVMEILHSLEVEPTRGHLLTGGLRGTRALEFSLKGSGTYRAVYYIRADRVACIVFIVGPHENIYDRAERRLEAIRRGEE
jgi:mRNA-degrading endonuclease RelE of RelBE toxin-antitoxin system